MNTTPDNSQAIYIPRELQQEIAAGDASTYALISAALQQGLGVIVTENIKGEPSDRFHVARFKDGKPVLG